MAKKYFKVLVKEAPSSLELLMPLAAFLNVNTVSLPQDVSVQTLVELSQFTAGTQFSVNMFQESPDCKQFFQAELPDNFYEQASQANLEEAKAIVKNCFSLLKFITPNRVTRCYVYYLLQQLTQGVSFSQPDLDLSELTDSIMQQLSAEPFEPIQLFMLSKLDFTRSYQQLSKYARYPSGRVRALAFKALLTALKPDEFF